MNKLKTIILTLTGLVLMLSACHDSKSYSELLREEERAVNWYMSNHRVVNEVPADTVFETGKDAPFYKLDEEGNLYMQVVSAGTPGNKAKYDQQIYFRYMREILLIVRGRSPRVHWTMRRRSSGISTRIMLSQKSSW